MNIRLVCSALIIGALTAVAPPLERADVKSTERKPAPVPANGRSIELAPKTEIVAIGA